MGKYVKCPRCELNWILEENEYCDVCKAELGMEGFTLLEDEDEDMLCPVCGVNYIEHGERMCADCKSKQKEDSAAFESDSPAASDEQSDVEVISFDELEQEETDDKFDIYDDTFDDPDGFADTDFDGEEEEEEEEEEEVSEDDELEDDFNYDIDGVDTSDLDDEDEEDEDEDEDL